MLDLYSFFDGMSKPLLRDVHAKAYGKKGLLNNALIQSEVMSFFSDKARAASLFEKMEPWQRRCMNLLYHSGPRGLTYNELRLTVPVSKNKELRAFLLEMCREFLIWRSQTSGTAVYRGFADFARCFEIKPQESTETLTPEPPKTETPVEEMWEITFVVSGSRSQFAALKEFLVKTGMKYRRA